MPLINWSDSLSGVDVLTDVGAARVIAEQINGQRATGVPEAVDLSDAIVDIVLEWAVQGSAILELHIVDPDWLLLTSGFIAVDDAGMLIPVEVNYPIGTDCRWWLAACNPTTDLGGANLTLTFEDKITSQLRDVQGAQGGRKTANTGETRAHFIGALVATVPGARFWSPSMQQELDAGKFVGVGNAIYTGTLNPVVTPPASSKQPGASAQRKNPTKQANTKAWNAWFNQQYNQEFNRLARNPGLVSQGSPDPSNRGAYAAWLVWAKKEGATWNGTSWVYGRKAKLGGDSSGLTPPELRILNPPTNQPDGPVTGIGATGGGNF